MVFCLPLFAAPDGLGGYDWDQHFVFYASVLKSVVEYGQLPFWNPWTCGGNVLWQNAQVPLVSPVYPLATFLSLALAMKVNIVLHYWIGLLGMHLLVTRGIGLTFLPAVIYLSVLYTFSGAAALHLAVGHSVFLPAFYLPWLLLFVVRALRGGLVRDALLAGAVMALTIYNGGFHVVPMSVVAIGGISLVAAAAARSWRPLVMAATVCAAGAALAAPRLLPVVLFVNGDRFLDGRSPTEHPDAMTLEMLSHAYTDRFQVLGYRFAEQRHGWWEFGNYIGEIGLLLILASMVAVVLRRGEPDRPIGLALACTAAGLLALSAGEFSAAAPASLLAYLPVFSSLRAPSRNTIAFVLVGTTAVAWAWRAFELQRPDNARLKTFVAVLCVLAAAHLMAQNRRLFTGVFMEMPLNRSFRWLGGPPEVTPDGETSAWGPNSPMLRALMIDRVFFNCYESLRLIGTATPGTPMVSSDGARIADVVFSPNRVTFAAVGGSQPSRVFMNQNFEYGWRSSAGPVTFDPARGAITATLGPGETGTFTFSYVPPGLIPGIAIFVAALVGGRLLWGRRL